MPAMELSEGRISIASRDPTHRLDLFIEALGPNPYTGP